MSVTLRTDLTVVPLPKTLPNFGGLKGSNTIQTDPDFGTQIVRLTDADTSSNGSLQTADEAEAGIWNTDDTLLFVRTTGGASLLYGFNPVTMQGTKLNLPHYGGEVRFSGVNPYVFYQLEKTKLSQLTLTNSNGTWSTKSKLVCDFAEILTPAFVVKWSGTLGMSQDDTTFTVAFSQGVQETGFNVCVYKEGKGFRMLNTQTGEITGYGTTGAAVLNSKNFTFPFFLHEANGSPNPAYSTLGTASGVSDTIVWFNDTLELYEVECTGHAARGVQHIYPGGMGGGQVAQFAYSNTTKSGESTVIPPANLPAGYIGDRHFGFGKYDPNDNSVIWSSSLNTAGISAAWENEVFGYDTAAHVVYRACHTFGSGKSTEFITLNTIACPSQTGKFVAFSSDMQGTLGSTSGEAKGVLGKNCRGDVFVVRVA